MSTDSKFCPNCGTAHAAHAENCFTCMWQFDTHHPFAAGCECGSCKDQALEIRRYQIGEYAERLYKKTGLSVPEIEKIVMERFNCDLCDIDEGMKLLYG